jgi:hypothetical protein
MVSKATGEAQPVYYPGNTMNSDRTTTKTCNALLRGDSSAIETYTQVIVEFRQDAGESTFEGIRVYHVANAESVGNFVGECGEETAIGSQFWTMDHEFIGVLEEVGKSVNQLKPGGRVAVPSPVTFGACFFCDIGLPGHCEHSMPERYGREGGIHDRKGGGMPNHTNLYDSCDGG